MSWPSSSRWRAFSVSPPSATRSSESWTVSRRKSRSSAARRGAGRVRISPASVTPPSFQVASAICRARNDGSPCAVDPGGELVRGQAGEPRSCIGRHEVKASAGGSRARKHAAPDDRRLPAQERFPGHALAARGLHLDEAQALTIADAEAAIVEGAARRPAGPLGSRRPDDDPVPTAYPRTSPGHG